MKRFISLAMVCALSLSLLAGCGKGKNGGDSTFTVALDSDIVALDPAFAYDFTTNPVINQITEGLLTFDENNELVPWLASDWSQTDDTTYVYTIRDDVCFSDGTPMTMDDVMFSLERTMNPDTGSYLQWMFSPCRKYRADRRLGADCKAFSAVSNMAVCFWHNGGTYYQQGIL